MRVPAQAIDTVLFDLGKVAVNWDPRNFCRKIFKTEGEMERFLLEADIHGWTMEMDAGKPFAQALEERLKTCPQWADHLKIWDEGWADMVLGEVEGTGEVIVELKERGVPIFGLSNFSMETWAKLGLL